MATADKALAAGPSAAEASSSSTLQDGYAWPDVAEWSSYSLHGTCGPTPRSMGALEQKLLSSELPVIVSFGAPWCRPCRKMAPSLKELGKELQGQALVVKVNIDKRQRLAEQFDVTVVPTTVILRDGEEAARYTGFLSKAFLARQVRADTTVAARRSGDGSFDIVTAGGR